MIERDARFYFANLASDVVRSARAGLAHQDARYTDSRMRAQKTLTYLRHAARPEAYEEGLLLMRGLDYARQEGRLELFSKQVDKLVETLSPLRVDRK